MRRDGGRMLVAKLGAYGVVFLVGVAMGGAGVGYFAWRTLADSFARNMASTVQGDAIVLAELRLGRTERAVSVMEQDLDLAVTRLVQRPDGRLDAGHLSAAERESLSFAKVYRAAYPSAARDGRRMDAFLATMPALAVKRDCDAGICRLVRVPEAGAGAK